MCKLLFGKIAKLHSDSLRFLKHLYLGNWEERPEKDFAYAETICSIRGTQASVQITQREAVASQLWTKASFPHSLKTVVFVQSERGVSTSPAGAPLPASVGLSYCLPSVTV